MYKDVLEDPALKFEEEQDEVRKKQKEQRLKRDFQFFQKDLENALHQLSSLEARVIAAAEARKQRKLGKK